MHQTPQSGCIAAILILSWSASHLRACCHTKRFAPSFEPQSFRIASFAMSMSHVSILFWISHLVLLSCSPTVDQGMLPRLKIAVAFSLSSQLSGLQRDTLTRCPFSLEYFTANNDSAHLLHSRISDNCDEGIVLKDTTHS